MTPGLLFLYGIAFAGCLLVVGLALILLALIVGLIRTNAK